MEAWRMGAFLEHEGRHVGLDRGGLLMEGTPSFTLLGYIYFDAPPRVMVSGSQVLHELWRIFRFGPIFEERALEDP